MADASQAIRSHAGSIEDVRSVLTLEAAAVLALADAVDESTSHAVDLILNCRGQVVISGLGKTGLIGAKISATLASTGTPSHFVHASDALHGDAGRIRPGDVLIVLSNSGESREVEQVMGIASARHVPVIAMTGSTQSTIARAADVVLVAHADREADPLNMAPTVSTTLALAFGDAIAVSVMRHRNFDRSQFLLNHPGGSLGATAAGGPL